MRPTLGISLPEALPVHVHSPSLGELTCACVTLGSMEGIADVLREQPIERETVVGVVRNRLMSPQLHIDGVRGPADADLPAIAAAWARDPSTFGAALGRWTYAADVVRAAKKAPNQYIEMLSRAMKATLAVWSEIRDTYSRS